MNYAMGVSDEEVRRLKLQAECFEPYTRRFLALAGVTTGNRVLDIGSGVGDVTLLAAELVGPSGHVLGVDVEARMVEAARARAGAFTNVSFEQASLAPGEIGERFDVALGRLVLLFQPDPVEFIRRAAQRVRPGGAVAFIDRIMKPKPAWSDPPLAAYDRLADQLHVALAAVGAHTNLGASLESCFLEAGLHRPALLPPNEQTQAEVEAFLPAFYLACEVSFAQAREKGVACPSPEETRSLTEEVSRACREGGVRLHPPVIVGGVAYVE